ncbi:MAG: type I methionyl aminopeptidase [Gemmatimonadetes bacterium]|nr:type I methionyl aminopeptidase [Gemmatimonadota bacterium]
MIHLKSVSEIEAIARAGHVLARLFAALAHEVRPGAATAELDAFAEEFIRAHPGAEPAFKGLYGFPASLCISVDHEVVHGIPSKRRVLREGEIVSVDAGVHLDGWYADAAFTYPVGAIDRKARRLLEVTQEALRRGIAQARTGNRLGDIGHAIQKTAEDAGYNVVRDLVGHGIGRDPHEEPQVPNFGRPGRGPKLEPGMVLAIEPMINEGRADVRTLEDRWTVVTADRRRSAHFEHTVAVTENGPKVLTAAASPAAAGQA